MAYSSSKILDELGVFEELGVFPLGDLQQLAPVVKDNEWELLRKHYETPYFFASHALKETAYMTIELKKVYRQSDTFFLSLLNIRGFKETK